MEVAVETYYRFIGILFSSIQITFILKGGGGLAQEGSLPDHPTKKIMPQFDDTGKNKKVIGIHLSQSGNITCKFLLFFFATIFMLIIPSQIFVGSEEVTLVFLPTVPLYLIFTITSTHIYLSPLLHWWISLFLSTHDFVYTIQFILCVIRVVTIRLMAQNCEHKPWEITGGCDTTLIFLIYLQLMCTNLSVCSVN